MREHGRPRHVAMMTPGATVEARENQMISLAVDQAEKQLREGTAPAQIVTHYLKLAATRERLEKEKLETEIELLKAKKEAIESSRKMEEMYAEALAAMKRYEYDVDEE